MPALLLVSISVFANNDDDGILSVDKSCPDLWNVLHDGCIEKIQGSVPGDLYVYVSIEYLRERFTEQGEFFILKLGHCTEFSFLENKSSLPESNLKWIADQCCSILSAEVSDAGCTVWADNGILKIQSETIEIALDSGRRISLDELKSVATDYWEQWQRESEAN